MLGPVTRNDAAYGTWGKPRQGRVDMLYWFGFPRIGGFGFMCPGWYEERERRRLVIRRLAT